MYDVVQLVKRLDSLHFMSIEQEKCTKLDNNLLKNSKY